MKPREELKALGEKCKARGCKCLRRCYKAWNRYWPDKAEGCTRPNWAKPDEEKI